ncbi:hypothetical protein ONS95_006366 [Cadophora gregata]|uniref:uncharacterized protein n=1 Tax=Cadophora gregata TaxID=51156 RepID=UPI0026DCA8D6|nr:uncharacterized protein ONS95_006366 [Cadophora gregata]KAK0102769.1 hypothetical protein ONS95_006366 [Cadophora gregata]
MRLRPSVDYGSHLEVHLIEHNENEELYHPLHTPRTRFPTATKLLLVSNIFWMTLLSMMVLHHYPVPGHFGTESSHKYGSLRPNLKPPRPTIFDDQLRFNSTSHEFWRDLDSQQPQYFGRPSPDIDLAWEELLHGEFLGISDKEALQNPHLDFDEEERVPQTGQFILQSMFSILYIVSMLYGRNSTANITRLNTRPGLKGIWRLNMIILYGLENRSESIYITA